MAQRGTSKRPLMLCLAGMMAAGIGHAGIIYSAPPNQSGGSDANGFLEADDITLAGSTRLGLITFWSLQTIAGDYTGSVAWSFRSDAGGMPGASAASGTATPAGTSTGKSAFGLHEYAYTFSTDVTLGPGTYWVVLHNGPANTIPSTDFFWEWSNGNAGNSMAQDLSLPAQPWVSNFAELALQVQDIPEPGSLLPAGAGLLALWLGRRRRHDLHN